MNLTLTLPALTYLIGLVLGTIVSLICFAYPQNREQASIRYLAGSLLSLTWTLLILFLSESGLLYYVPHLFQTSYITTLTYLPFSYFFIRKIYEDTKLSRYDLIHALPVILFIIDYSTVYFSPASEKLDFILSHKDSAYVFQEGWLFPSSVHKPVRFILFFIYSGLQFRIALNAKSGKRWGLLYLSAQFALIFYYVLYQFSFDPFVWRLITMLISIYLVFIAVALLFHPRMLYYHEFLAAETKLVDALKKHENEHLTDRKMQITLARLETLIKTESPFLRHRYSIHDLSNAMHMPAYQLSSFLNHYLGVSFNDFMNKYRVMHCLERIEKGAAEHITLEALAFECGFNNRNSFTAAFKRVTGMTPTEFLRAQKKGILEPAKDS